jgi:hypothetical protein
MWLDEVSWVRDRQKYRHNNWHEFVMDRATTVVQLPEWTSRTVAMSGNVHLLEFYRR